MKKISRISGKLSIQIVFVCFALAGCRGQTLPTATVAPPAQTATTVLSASTIAPATPLEQTATSILSTPTIVPVNTQQAEQAATIQILGMNFFDADHGWLLAVTYKADGRREIVIRQTMDSGVSWTPVPAPDVQPASWMDLASSNSNLVHQIRFVDEQTGWIYSPSLFYTQDGGKDWRLVDLGGAIAALEPAGPNGHVWAVIQNCPQMPECSAQLYQTTPNASGQWTLVSDIPIQHPMLAFSRPDPENGYLLSNIGSDNFQVSLIATYDGGNSWTSLITPCVSEQPLLAASDVSNLYLVCSGLPGAGQQGKQFYTSTDGGISWRLIQNSNNDKTIPTFGYAEALVFLTSKVGVVGLGRSSLSYTSDGGESWINTEILNNQDASGWVLAKAGGQDIFASLGATVFHSIDGGVSWTSTEIH